MSPGGPRDRSTGAAAWRARAAAAFSHPNVVTVYDYGVEADSHAFLVMELLEGATLREELRRSTRLTATRAIKVFHPVCSAVEAAHRDWEGRQVAGYEGYDQKRK
jgi:serine/threonine-protein kinase